MNSNRDNFEDSGIGEPFDGAERTPEFSHEHDGQDGDAAAPVGPEWFDPRWLRANGATKNDEGEVVPADSSPVLVLVAEPAQTAPEAEKLDEVLREFGVLAWPRPRSRRVPTLMEQLAESERAHRQWLEANPFAVFWIATVSRVAPPRRRRNA